jgi:hypothetical protein
MSLAAGSTVGRYQIHHLLGSGGMGEVYKAQDSTLNRPVALKVLRQELSADPERLSRFLHEARAASALNHPNIHTIHEVGDHDRSRFLVSEFVDGETVRQRVARGPITLREILDITIQTASALAAAHAAGIVHRDIKPDNLMLRPDGYVKVLDFGVAQFARAAGPSDAMATVATIAHHETGAGMIVGTIAYMSPEQARGLPVDGRSDCYSLGVVLYEMVTGRTPFAAPTPTDMLVAILEREPPSLRAVARGLPAELVWIVEKALEKDPGLRYQTIADLRVDLQRLKNALESGKLASAAGAVTAPAADAVFERALTDDSPEVAPLGRVTWTTAALGGAAVALLVAAMSYYHLARPGAELPLQLPEGAAVTKARDVIQLMGYQAGGTRTDTEFGDTLDVDDVTIMAGLPAAREAIREGATGQWMVGITQTVDPGSVGTSPRAGDFAVRLDPKGQLVTFATGPSDAAKAAHVDRDRATAIGLDALKTAYKIDASGYELEVIQRAFPAGTTEMTWRSPSTRFGHVEQLRANLQGDKVVFIERSFQRPRDYVAPPTPFAVRAFQTTGPILIGSLFVIGWGFGLYVLFKTRNWDALTKPIPLAMCGIVLMQVLLSQIGSSGIFQSLLGVIVVAILLIGTVLPALSGVLSWIGRRSPARLWAAEQLAHGRLLVPAVSASIVDGVSSGVAVAAISVLGDWGALAIDGFVPSVSREMNAVDTSIGSLAGETLAESAFLTLGIAFAVELFDRFRLPPAVSTLIIALGAGLVSAADQPSIVAALPLVAAQGIGAAIVILLYRYRGFLSAWVAALTVGLVLDALAARSLHDPALLQLSNYLFTLVVVLGAAGAWGVVKPLMRKSPAAVPQPPTA